MTQEEAEREGNIKIKGFRGKHFPVFASDAQTCRSIPPCSQPATRSSHWALGTPNALNSQPMSTPTLLLAIVHTPNTS